MFISIWSDNQISSVRCSVLSDDQFSSMFSSVWSNNQISSIRFSVSSDDQISSVWTDDQITNPNHLDYHQIKNFFNQNLITWSKKLRFFKQLREKRRRKNWIFSHKSNRTCAEANRKKTHIHYNSRIGMCVCWVKRKKWSLNLVLIMIQILVLELN